MTGPASDPAPELAPDRRAHQAWLLDFAALPDGFPAGGLAVDLGCGRGGDLLALAARHPGAADPAARFVGLDASPAAVAHARAAARAAGRGAGDERVAFEAAALDGALPFADAAVDLVFTHNLVECLPDRAAFAAEVARVLRPGGLVVAAHWDFDSQAFDAPDDVPNEFPTAAPGGAPDAAGGEDGKALVRRLVHAFADLRQPWMARADGWMGRRLWGVFAASGRFDGDVHARVLTNTAYASPWYGHAMAASMHALVRRGLATPSEYARFVGGLEALDRAGRYCYAITGYAYVGRRR